LLKKLKIFTASPQYHLASKVQKNLRKILKVISKDNCYLVSLFLIGKKRSRGLNYQYRNINKPTDVLAFPFYYWYKQEINCSTNHCQDLGDIFICYPVAVKQSKEKKCSLEKEIYFLFLHGLLHLLGYDHEEKNERTKMFLLQDKILKQLCFK